MSYSWGDDSSGSGSGLGFGGYDYSSARKAYSKPSDSQGKKSRSIQSASLGKAPVGQIIKSDAENIINVRIDVTGSNRANAEVFFKKLPLLYVEASRCMSDLEISFGAAGDAYTDDYPLQVRDFGQGPELDAELNALHPEGYGGGQGKETYELNAYYDLKCCEIPNAVNPFYFLLCDEGFYPEVQPSHVRKYIGIDMDEPMSAKEVFQQLMQKFNVYILRCRYNNVHENKVHQQWVDMFGPKRVVLLEEAARVVDCMIGIIAAETGEFDDFSQRLSSRQTSVQVDSVMKSLRFVDKGLSGDSGNSIRSTGSVSMRSKKLI
ncbi:hypothetical protein ACFL2R_03805 [Patescibacteria group bacterium]